jgi:hypothetical protein
MLDSGEYATVSELARGEGVNPSHASRLLRLTLLAPGVVEAILDARQPATVTLEMLLQPVSVVWAEQQRALLAVA